MKKKSTTVTLVSLLVLVLAVQPSYAILGVFDIVYDPTVEATIAVQTAMQSTNWVQQLLNQVEQIKTAVDSYIKLKETYDKIKETYDLAKKMSQYLTGLDAYALALGGWQGPGSSKDLFGVTSGIQMAMGGSLSPDLGKSYGNSTNPLNSYAAEVIASMNALTKDRIKANASTVTIADAASQQAFATVGSVAGAIAGSEPRVAALTSAALSDDPDMNTHAALLNRINVASAYSLAGQHDANKLLAVIANSQAVLLKEQRERYADEINRDIYLKNNFKKDWEWASTGATEAYKAIRISDYTSF
jgi:hypothetical protein